MKSSLGIKAGELRDGDRITWGPPSQPRGTLRGAPVRTFDDEIQYETEQGHGKLRLGAMLIVSRG